MCRKDFDGQREFGGIPSLLEELHKSMNKNWGSHGWGDFLVWSPQDARWHCE
jgi:hypothetical protein